MALIINPFFKTKVYSAMTDCALADQLQNLDILFWKTLKPFETLFLCTRTPETHPQFSHPRRRRHHLPLNLRLSCATNHWPNHWEGYTYLHTHFLRTVPKHLLLFTVKDKRWGELDLWCDLAQSSLEHNFGPPCKSVYLPVTGLRGRFGNSGVKWE